IPSNFDRSEEGDPMSRSVWGLAILFSLVPVYGQNPAYDNRRIPVTSLEQEIILGRQLAADTERSARIVTDPTISEYVNRIAQSIVRNSGANTILVTSRTKVIDSADSNAFAFPGGFVFITTGLIQTTADESELASA